MKNRVLVLLVAKPGKILIGGVKSHLGGPFETQQLADDYLTAAKEHNGDALDADKSGTFTERNERKL